MRHRESGSAQISCKVLRDQVSKHFQCDMPGSISKAGSGVAFPGSHHTRETTVPLQVTDKTASKKPYFSPTEMNRLNSQPIGKQTVKETD